MFCQHCGAELPDGAKFCHGCGAPVGQQQSESVKEDLSPVSVEFFRRHSDWYGTIPAQIYIDGAPVAVIKDSGREYVNIAPGEHTLSIFMKKKERLTEHSFFIPSGGGHLYYTFVFGDITGTATCIDSNCRAGASSPVSASRQAPVSQAVAGPRCPKCGGPMATQIVSEGRKAGCGTVLLYVILFISILGWAVLIPLLLRKKSETVTYSICQNCGYKRVVSRMK